MIRFYFHPTPNPAKVSLLLVETALTYEVVPVDTSMGEQHLAAFRAVNPNGKLPAIADISAWGWIDRASRVLKGDGDPLAAYPNIKRWFAAIDSRPAVARARAVRPDHAFKKVQDKEARRHLFPSNYSMAA